VSKPSICSKNKKKGDFSMQTTTICHEKKKLKPKQCSSKPTIESMSLMSKLEELLLEGNDLNRIQLLNESLYEDISRIKNPEVLIDKFLDTFKFCYKQQKSLPDTCWSCFENKVVEFIYDPRFSGFFSSITKKRLILFNLPSDAIQKALYQKDN